MDIANSIALVTGANGGLGQYYVEALRSQGAAKIYAGARNPKALEALVADHPDIVIPIALDITDEQSVNQAAAQCPDVNLLINNAGVGFNQGLIAAPNLSQARMEIDVNGVVQFRVTLFDAIRSLSLRHRLQRALPSLKLNACRQPPL